MENYLWLGEFAEELCKEYKRRFKNDHHDLMAIKVLMRLQCHFPKQKMTLFPQDALPKEFQRKLRQRRSWMESFPTHHLSSLVRLFQYQSLWLGSHRETQKRDARRVIKRDYRRHLNEKPSELRKE
jgi:hypothetical protein